MSRTCHFCGKKPVSGHKISHSNIKTKIRHMPNLRKVKHVTPKGTISIYSCTRCLKTGLVSKPFHRASAAVTVVAATR